MPILTLDNIHLAFGHVSLLDGVDWVIEPGSKIGLIGRNGTGKSSLLKLLAGSLSADDGKIWRQPGLRLAYVAQEPELVDTHNVFEAVAQGLGDVRQLLLDYHDISRQLSDPQADHDSLLNQIGNLQAKLEAENGWQIQARVEKTLARLNLDAEMSVSLLSGGMKKRLALARALVTEPELLLLDEPTNHLDIAGIEWLEELITGFSGSVVVITHDRRFLDNVANQILELDRGKLRTFRGNFADYQRLKIEQLAIEATEQAKFDKFLAQEEVWIRKGVEARRTRNEGRVRRLEQLRIQRSERRQHQGQVQMNVDSGQRSGKLVAELSHVSKNFGDKLIINDFSATIQRNDRIGLIGPNGAGKSTLIKLILGEIAPDSGHVRLGTQLNIAYFDQFRDQLDEEATVADVISQGGDYVEIGGIRKHVISYLEDFLFAPARARSPVKSLSGGERNRLLLARLFTRPANMLILDEPTNDLDIDTLELLETLLQDYAGTVLLVSHDRTFLDNIVTQVIAFEGNGCLQEYVGGYADWLQQRPTTDNNLPTPKSVTVQPSPRPPANPNTRTTRKPVATLEQLMAHIAALEKHQAKLNQKLNDPELYQTNSPELISLQTALAETESALEQALEQWEALAGE